MLGTLVGDIYGSHFEKSRTLSRTLPELTAAHSFTDDTIITLRSRRITRPVPRCVHAPTILWWM